MFTWGMAWSSGKIINETLSYNNLVFLRFFISLLMLSPLIYLREINILNVSILNCLNIFLVSVLFYLYGFSVFSSCFVLPL